MEQGQCRVSPEDVYTNVHTLIAVLERQRETTWSRHIAHTLTESTIEEIFPPLRHELCGLRRAPVARALRLAPRLDALVAVLNTPSRRTATGRNGAAMPRHPVWFAGAASDNRAGEPAL